MINLQNDVLDLHPGRPDSIFPPLDLNVDFYSVSSALKGLSLFQMLNFIMKENAFISFLPNLKGTPERPLLWFPRPSDIGRRAGRTSQELEMRGR